jgi:hypothetical protein
MEPHHPFRTTTAVRTCKSLRRVTILLLIIAAVLFVAWIVSLFLLVVDSIGVGAKVVWFLALTLLAPFAIPVYLVTRRRRMQAEPA